MTPNIERFAVQALVMLVLLLRNTLGAVMLVNMLSYDQVTCYAGIVNRDFLPVLLDLFSQGNDTCKFSASY